MTRYSLDLSKTSNKILGLDISTSCTGYAILDVDLGCCVEIGFFQLDKFDNFFDKCDSFRKGLSELSKDHMTICDIFIEENLQAFRPGMSSAKTINTLARFNGAASLITYEAFNRQPVFLNAISARSSLGIKIDKKSDIPTKQQIFESVQSQILIEWPHTKTGKLKTSCYDMTDAYVLARAGWLKR